MNEVTDTYRNVVRPGPQLVAEAKRVDPTRPTIKSSGTATIWRAAMGTTIADR